MTRPRNLPPRSRRTGSSHHVLETLLRLTGYAVLITLLSGCVAPALVPVGPLARPAAANPAAAPASTPPVPAVLVAATPSGAGADPSTSTPDVAVSPTAGDPPAGEPATVATPPPAEPGNGPAAAAAYTLTVDLDYAGHTARVAQALRVANHSRSTWDRVVLQVPASRREGVFVLLDVLVENAPAGYEYDVYTATYAVHLAQPLAPGGAVLVEMTYVLNLPVTSFSTWFPAGNLGYGEHAIQFNNWYPMLVPYREGLGWYTWPWADIGDPFVSEVADYSLEVRAAPDVIIASGGPVESIPGVSRFRLARARAIGFTASPEYRVAQGTAGGVTLYSYYLAGHEAAGQAVLATMQQSLELFSHLYGPYPYATYTIGENAYLGSMEYSAFVSHSGDQYARYDGAPESTLVTLTAHETAHQWWYGLVGSDQAYEPWLDESLASYSETVYRCGTQPALCAWARARWGSRAEHGTLDLAIYDFASSYTYLRGLYPAGGQFMMVLHDSLGDDSFYAFLRDWRARGEGRLAHTREFLALLGRYLPTDCAPLVQEYFPGLTAQSAEAVLSLDEAARRLCGELP